MMEGGQRRSWRRAHHVLSEGKKSAGSLNCGGHASLGSPYVLRATSKCRAKRGHLRFDEMTKRPTASLARLPVTLENVEDAAGVLAGVVKRTNFDRSRTLS